jgi:predicted MPP superfamily phosphohydrolase
MLDRSNCESKESFQVHRLKVRFEQIPVFDDSQIRIKILHLSDLHMVPNRNWEVKLIKSLHLLSPDLVVCTGDFLAHHEAVETVLSSLNELLDVPGLYVFGSNDYYAPRFNNPLKYLQKYDGTRKLGSKLPTQDLDRELTRRGWVNLNNRKRTISIKDIIIDIRGTDDAHLALDDYSIVQGKPKGDISIGVTHAPYARVLNGMKSDGIDLIFAGHTHGGQVRVPWFGGSRSLTTNCDLPNWRSRGLTKLTNEPWLNVSAGMGFSPFAPVRIFCPPEVSLVTLISKKTS